MEREGEREKERNSVRCNNEILVNFLKPSIRLICSGKNWLKCPVGILNKTGGIKTITSLGICI